MGLINNRAQQGFFLCVGGGEGGGGGGSSLWSLIKCPISNALTTDPVPEIPNCITKELL